MWPSNGEDKILFCFGTLAKEVWGVVRSRMYVGMSMGGSDSDKQGV